MMPNNLPVASAWQVLGYAFEEGFFHGMDAAYQPRKDLEDLMEQALPAIPRLMDGLSGQNARGTNVFQLAFAIGKFMGHAERNGIIQDTGSAPVIDFKPESYGDPAGHWRHADVLFLHRDILYVMELTASGSLRTLVGLLNLSKDNRVNLNHPFIGNALNFGTITRLSDFPDFLDHLVKLTYRLPMVGKTELGQLYPETSKVIQASCYAASWIQDHPGQAKQVWLSVLSPTQEVFRIRLDVDHDRDFGRIKLLGGKLQARYHIIRGRSGPDVIQNNLKSLINLAKDDMQQAAGEIIITPKVKIQTLRHKVQDFAMTLPSRQQKTALMCTAAATGKTRAMMAMFTQQIQAGNKIGVIYATPRRAINDKIIEAAQGVFDVVENFPAMPAEPGRVHVIDRVGVVSSHNTPTKGIVRRACDEMVKLRSTRSWIMVMTTQAFTSPSAHGTNTVKRLIDTVAQERTRQFWVVIDEVLGSEGGMHVAAELMQATRKRPNLRLVVMDANLRDAETLDFLLQDVSSRPIIPPQVIIRQQPQAMPGWVETETPDYVAVFGAGYPARQAKVRVSFYEGDPILGIASYAKAALDEIAPDAQVYIYIQNREQVKAVAEALKDLGDVVALTSMDEVKGVEARVQTARFVVSTATTSRGIDASPRGQYCLMVFPLFNEEAELAEVGQVMSRLRGDKRFDDETKIIHGLFVEPTPNPEQQAKNINGLAQYYMEESHIQGAPLDDKQARIIAKTMNEITGIRHRQGLARLFKGVVQTFIAPERQTITPIRLLHAPVMRQTLPMMLDHAIKAVMDAENLGIPDWPEQKKVQELVRQVSQELGQDIPIPGPIKEAILQGQGLFYWPFALVNTKTEGRAWIGRRKVTREFIELAGKLAEWRRKRPDLRNDNQLESALDYLDQAKEGAVSNVETDVAIYVPWLITCSDDSNPPIVKFILPTVFGRQRLPVVRLHRHNPVFLSNDGIMAFLLATPGAIEQLQYSHGVVRMPLDWI